MTLRYPATLVLMIILSIATSRPGVAAGAPVPVFVSIVPQKYFVQQIGKDLVAVHVMVKPGASPATYEPRPAQMAALSRAKAYFAIGVPFERVWLEKIAGANPQMRLVHTDHGIQKLAMAVHGHPAGPEDREDDHGDHGIPDPHIWLSPALVVKQVRMIIDALEGIDPANGSVYRANGRAFIDRILDLDADLKDTFSGKTGLHFMVFHPGWGYFAHAYGLRQLPVELEGKTPKPAQLGKLVAAARARDIRVIFVQPQFSFRSARLIAREINGDVVVADPLALDWAANLRHVAEQFKAALR
jgi:zinc transport system substrate-binding protein